MLVAGCGGTVTDPTGDGTAQSGLQYDGSIVLPPDAAQSLELSAPLFPDATVFQQFTDASVYPSLSSADRVALVDDDVRVFEDLLTLCAPTHPQIKLRAANDPPLTAAEIAANYDEVARCAYEEYGAKPYWVPHHVDDVDVCARKLGEGWRLPTEADVAAWQENDFEFFQDTLTLPQSGQFPSYFYYSLDIYVRANDGTIALGNLAPQTQHVVPLPVSGADLDALYIGDGHPIGLRCVRPTSAAQ
jgi:hypothetical protein